VTQAESDAQFLAAGIRHFPEAHATVGAFRRLIAEKVELILNSSSPDLWTPKEVKTTRSEASGIWVGAGGPMLLKSGKTIVIDVGILWNSAYFDRRPATLAALYSVELVFGRRLDDAGERGVHLVRIGRHDWFANTSVADGGDVEDALRTVVEVAAAAVARAIENAPAPTGTRPADPHAV
jgi:hypothetical protein